MIAAGVGMDYDPLLYRDQYRERHNASWDRIRHENASSVRSEPADFLLLNNVDFQYNQSLPYADQSLVSNNYVPQAEMISYEPMLSNQVVNANQSIMDQSNQVEMLEPVNNYEPEEEEEEEEEQEEMEEDENEDDQMVDRPDVYCMECDSLLDEPTLHDVIACSRVQPDQFECSTCHERFNFETNLKVHRIVKHMKAVDFVRGSMCQLCQSDVIRTPFSRFSGYVGHVKMHTMSDCLRCEQCGEEFANERDLDRHVRRQHSPEVYELAYCPKCRKIIGLEETAAHLQLHRAQKPPKPKYEKKRRRPVRERKYKCLECSKCFMRPAELKRHGKTHERARLESSQGRFPKWKCAICFKEYTHQSGLNEHKRVAHGKPRKINCRVCGAEFTKKSNHDRHVAKIHPIGESTLPNEKDRPKFECPDCPTVFATLGSLTRHKRVFHNTVDVKNNKVIPHYERHVCRTCKREFRDANMLETHKRTHVFAEYRWRDLQGGGERKCDFCDKSFVLRASLLWHVQKHFEEQEAAAAEQQNEALEPYCSICDLNFYTQHEYRQHLDEQHLVVCGECQQKFTSRQVYEDHICNRRFATRNNNSLGNANSQLVPAGNRVVICRLCRPPQRLTTYRQIKEHRARHLPRKTHLCWTCHKSFRTAQLLSLHAEVHNRQPIQCTHCPQVFHSRVALKQHTRTAHGGDTNYQCVVHVDRNMAMSAQSFAEYGLGAEHSEHLNRAHSVTEWMDPPPQQDEDHQEMMNAPDELAEQLQYQVVPAHQQQQQQPSRAQLQIEAHPIRCEVCHHLYDNLEFLCDHWQGSDTDTDHSYGFVTCPLCELRIRGAADAANHMRSVHLFARPRILQFMKSSDAQNYENSMALVPMIPNIQTTSTNPPPLTKPKKRHQCVHCSRVFLRKNDLDRHVSIHSGEKEHQCQLCSARFRLKSILIQHMRTHSEDPPQFPCTVCEKAFFEKKTLLIHMRMHTGEQPFKCRFCDLHFRTPAMQRTHEKRCSYGGPHRPILPDPTTLDASGSHSNYQPHFDAPVVEINRTITQISTLPPQSLQLSRHSAFQSVEPMHGMGSSDIPIYVITKPVTDVEYVVIVQKTKPVDSTVRFAVDTVSEIKLGQLRESTNLSIVLHREMRLNLNTVKMLQMLVNLRPEAVFKARVTVAAATGYGDDNLVNEGELFSIIAHSKGGAGGAAAFIRRCDICEVDLPTKMISDAHFYSEDHETAQLMYPTTTNQPSMARVRNPGVPDLMASNASEFNCKLCGSLFLDMDSLLNHIRREHDEPTVPPRPFAHTAPIN